MKAEAAREPERQEELVDFPELARTFGRYKWGIIGLTLLVSAIAALVAFSLRPMYRGSVTLLIESQNQRVARIGDVYDNTTPEMEFLGAQIAVLQSREIARQAVERLGLANDAEFLEEPSPGRFKLLDLREYLPFLPELLSIDGHWLLTGEGPMRRDDPRASRVALDHIERALREMRNGAG